MRKFLVGTAVLSGLGALLVAATALATPGSGFTAAQQWTSVFDEIDVKSNRFLPHQAKVKTKEESDVWVTRNAIAAGGHSGWHTHPGPSLILVTEGAILAYDADDPTCTPTRYEKGQGLVDPGDGEVHLLRNESSVVPAETVAVQILPKGAPRRIDEPVAPADCPSF